MHNFPASSIGLFVALCSKGLLTPTMSARVNYARRWLEAIVGREKAERFERFCADRKPPGSADALRPPPKRDRTMEEARRESVEEFLAYAIKLEQEAAIRFGQLADAIWTPAEIGM